MFNELCSHFVIFCPPFFFCMHDGTQVGGEESVTPYPYPNSFLGVKVRFIFQSIMKSATFKKIPFTIPLSSFAFDWWMDGRCTLPTTSKMMMMELLQVASTGSHKWILPCFFGKIGTVSSDPTIKSKRIRHQHDVQGCRFIIIIITV